MMSVSASRLWSPLRSSALLLDKWLHQVNLLQIMTTSAQRENGEANTNARTSPRQPIKWVNVFILATLHILAAYGFIYVCLHGKWKTFIFVFIYGYMGGFGVTGGAHRLWTHKSYKAKLPLRILLMVFYVSTGMNPLFEWVRDHRVHHKYSESNADPHNSNRGLFFSHVGWLMQKKHPEVLRRGRKIDMKDVMEDPVVVFQQKYFVPMYVVLVIVLPISIPCYFWDEPFWISFYANMVRWVGLLNVVWSVNSFAHAYGYRPYNRNIKPAENVTVAIVSLGEGWHNYHHAFPWDYKTAEFGIYIVNWTTGLLDMFAKIGWAYDLRQPSRKMVEEFVMEHGDRPHIECSNDTGCSAERSYTNRE